MSHGPFGKRPERLPVEQGGTAASTEAEAREILDVPTLTGPNTFAGACTFTAAQTVGQTIHANTQLATDGSVAIGSGTIDAALLTGVQTYSLPDLSGTLALATSLIPTYKLNNSTGNHTLGATDCVWNITSGSPTITLPTAVGIGGRAYIVKNSGAGTITMATTSAQTVDGAAPGTIAAGNSLTFVSDGANWILV